MIEIIEMEQKEERIKEWRSLPKNVRQIGEGGKKQKIYIEDYVITYLNKMARPDQVYARGAILFGDLYETEEGEAIFISGAVEADNLELDMDETIFNENIWRNLTEKGERYFPGQKIMGWFLSRIGFSVEMNQKIINTHKKNFPGEDKVLYMCDYLEKEEAMYLFEHQQMKKQKGYYIYYEKNSPMREYMLGREDVTGKKSSEQECRSELRRDRKIVNSYRRMNHYRNNKKKQDTRIKAIRGLCGVLIFVMLFFIAGKLGNHFVNMGVEDYAITTFQAMKNVFLPREGVVEEETHKSDVAEILVTKEEITEEVLDETDGMEEALTYPKPMFYVVRKGDTLAAISRKMYMTDQYTNKIAEANNLSNADQIYEGQQLIIPSVE